MNTMPTHAPLFLDEFETRDADGYGAQRHLSNEDRKVFTRRAAETTEGAMPAVRHARELLYAMGAYPETGLTHHRISLLLRLLSKLTTSTSVYPLIAPDGRGGVSFEWIAAPRHLSLDLPDSGGFTFSEVNGEGMLAEFVEDSVPHMPLHLIAARIEAFSEYVNGANPDWRSNF